jgi:xanthine dehydrogenase YagS FAD-binding subunit
MKAFAHFDARSVEEAGILLDRFGEGAKVIAGGTDLLGTMKDRIQPRYPEALINIKTIPGLDAIEETEGGISIGALVPLAEIAEHPVIRSRYAALSEAAGKTASPQIRNMGTIGGNLCQDIRCWYYRAPHNRFSCLRKGGGRCYAIDGDNRFHSIFGASVKGGCFAVHPSDTAPALIALDGKIITSKREVKAEDFFRVAARRTTILEGNEIVTRIALPPPVTGFCSAFQKFALRKSIDFPIVNCAAAISMDDHAVSKARICLNGVSIVPHRARGAEEALTGKPIDETNAINAGATAVADAEPMRHNHWMVQIAKTFVKRAVLGCTQLSRG